jgi:hypothetical protein
MSMKKQTSGLHLKKVRLQEAHVLSYLIDHIGPIFNQKCHFLDFFLIFVYGFLDFFRFLKIQKADSA